MVLHSSGVRFIDAAPVFTNASMRHVTNGRRHSLYRLNLPSLGATRSHLLVWKRPVRRMIPLFETFFFKKNNVGCSAAHSQKRKMSIALTKVTVRFDCRTARLLMSPSVSRCPPILLLSSRRAQNRAFFARAPGRRCSFPSEESLQHACFESCGNLLRANDPG